VSEPQPEALAAFLAGAQYAILEAPQGSDEDASEALIAAGCWYAPRLLAAIENARKLADEWDVKAAETWGQGHRHGEARELREAISRALLGEGE
jgi:hypothetical protein